jgi:hypothetical protein
MTAYPSGATRAEFVSSGPIFDGETLSDAMARNTIAHVVRHAVRRPPAAGQGEPLDAAEKTARNAAAFDHEATSRGIRAALRPGAGR